MRMLLSKAPFRFFSGAALVAWLGIAFGSACGLEEQQGSATLQVRVAPDESVSGLSPGDATENVRDGWAIDFDKYLVAIGEIELHLSTDENVEAHGSEVRVVDLARLPTEGVSVAQLSELRAGRWAFHYATPVVREGASRDPSVDEVDFDVMLRGAFSYLVEGELTKVDGRSCPPTALASPPDDAVPAGVNAGGDACYASPKIRFAFGADAQARFGPCELDGIPGIALTGDSTQTVTATIHGDHLFFNGFPEGTEGGVLRLAQWLADCDLDLDGVVTREELASIAPAALPELDERFQLGGSPITPLANMYDYARAQLQTQGHMNGEGECPLEARPRVRDESALLGAVTRRRAAAAKGL